MYSGGGFDDYFPRSTRACRNIRKSFISNEPHTSPRNSVSKSFIDHDLTIENIFTSTSSWSRSWMKKTTRRRTKCNVWTLCTVWTCCLLAGETIRMPHLPSPFVRHRRKRWPDTNENDSLRYSGSRVIGIRVREIRLLTLNLCLCRKHVSYYYYYTIRIKSQYLTSENAEQILSFYYITRTATVRCPEAGLNQKIRVCLILT